MSRKHVFVWPAAVLILTVLCGGVCALADAPPAATSAPGAPAAGRLDVRAATDAYLAKMSAEQRAKSDAYFEGGYWLILWDFLYGAAVLLLLLHLGWSAGMRDRADRLAGRLGPRFRWTTTFLYWAQMFTTITILQCPMAIYEGYVREHQYGLATQTFGPWLGDQAMMYLVNLILLGVLLTLLYALVRRLRSWWVWGGIVSVCFITFVNVIAPVFIFPLFNTFTRLDKPEIREPILALARANGIPADDVYVVDASRQTTRVSANVSGMLGTTRITINDNMLKRCSLPEIEASMGHEMGHYVLHHNYKGTAALGLVVLMGFVFLHLSFDWATRRFGSRWRIGGIGDLAGLPLLALLFSVYFLVMTPVSNSIIRIEEAEADLFGVNASQQPDGAAEIALKLGEYRKMSPGEWEEILFFDHPSGRNRIEMAMRWKAEHEAPGVLASAPPSAP